MMSDSSMVVFAGNASTQLAQDIASHLKLALGKAHVGQFSALFAPFITFLKRLLAVLPGDEPGHFAHFLGKHGHVGELAEIAHAGVGNPLVNGLLGFGNGHGIGMSE